MYAVDLHCHTRFFHGVDRLGQLYDPLGASVLARVARAKHMDGVAHTNHDYYRDVAPDVADVTTVPGIEITTTDGHVVVVGPDPPAETEPETLTPREAVDLAHERGCAAIIAHPFRNSIVRHSEADFDAVEINGKSSRMWDRARDVAEERDLPLVGGSDAHYPFEVGRAYTAVEADALTPESVAEAIRTGAVEPGVRYGTLPKLLQKGYDVSHLLKGHRTRESPGVGEPPET